MIRITPNTVYNLSHTLFLTNMFIAFNLMRLPDILSFSALRFFLYFIFFIGFGLGFLSSYLKFKRISICFLVFIISIIAHAFTNFYQPSLRLGISIQNYIMQQNITSDFEMTQTRLYMLFVVLFIFPAFSFFSDLYNNYLNEKYQKIFFILLLVSAISNSFVAIYQGMFDIQFLSQGSGTSVEVKRAPALLEDSGVASLFFTCCLAISFTSIFSKNIKYKSFFIISSLLFIFSGFMNDSRGFYLGIFISFIIFLFFNIFKLIKEKKQKSIAITFISFISLISISVFYIHKVELKTPGIKRIINQISHINLNNNLISLYSQIDLQRANHLEIMLKSINADFFIGTGLGSFATNFYQYKKIGDGFDLDLPSNMYFSILSELGIVGFALIVFFLYISSYFLWQQTKNSNQNSIKNFIGKTFIICLIIPILFFAFISYFLSYASTAFLSVCIFAACIITFIRKNPKHELFCSSLFLILSLYLICSCGYLISKSPPIPSFRWKERGEPQLPQPVGALPQPQGHKESKKIYFAQLVKSYLSNNDKLFKPLGAQEGIWVPPKTEIVILKKNIRIYIGSDSKKFPTQVHLKFYNKEKITYDKDVAIREAGWISIAVPEDKSFNECYNNITQNSYCYFYINVSPGWKLSLFNEVGFYIENKFLEFSKGS